VPSINLDSRIQADRSSTKFNRFASAHEMPAPLNRAQGACNSQSLIAKSVEVSDGYSSWHKKESSAVLFQEFYKPVSYLGCGIIPVRIDFCCYNSLLKGCIYGISNSLIQT